MSAGIANVSSKGLKWREAASLILLVKEAATKSNGFDYKALLFSRSEKASFMPKACVFPGGVREAADESSEWVKHFQDLGINKERLNKFVMKRDPSLKPQPSIFSNSSDVSCIPKDISLRITAIRETFEEVGIMLCRGRNSLSKDEHNYGAFISDFDVKHWQREVHNDASKFLTLCRELDVVPDLWSLNEWSVWLTPAAGHKKRFQSAFYSVALRSQPEVHLEKNEGIEYTWKSSKEYLHGYRNKEFLLQPPQFYELSRLLNFAELEDLIQFSKKRSRKGTILTLPVQVKCTDGLVRLYHGDSAYPDNPNDCTEVKETGMSTAEFRSTAKKLHRAEFLNPYHGTIQVNIQPLDGHKNPLNV